MTVTSLGPRYKRKERERQEETDEGRERGREKEKGWKGNKTAEREREREVVREEKGERRDAGTCVSHGLPIATHAANARVIGASYRPRYTGCLRNHTFLSKRRDIKKSN